MEVKKQQQKMNTVETDTQKYINMRCCSKIQSELVDVN